MTRLDKHLSALELEMIKELYGTMSIEGGAYNIRIDGTGILRQDSNGIKIVPKPEGRGIDIYVAPGITHALAHIPVLLTEDGLYDTVENDFYIGEQADVVIMAGCGIHSDAKHLTQHNGIHRFHVGQGAKVRYSETHIGKGDPRGHRVLNPTTEVFLKEDSLIEMVTTQIAGVDKTERITKCDIGDRARLIIQEKIMTTDHQTATTEYTINLNGADSKSSLSSRSVAKGSSSQTFRSVINGNNACLGHSECDAIIMDNGQVKAVPNVSAYHPDAQLIHEAAIGKIANDQIIKLETLGLSCKQAEQKIVDGFLR